MGGGGETGRMGTMRETEITLLGSWILTPMNRRVSSQDERERERENFSFRGQYNTHTLTELFKLLLIHS